MSKSVKSDSRESAPARAMWAAGGVLWRRSKGAVQIGVVHRPRYDDWTLPKGKLDAGETLIDTAVREIDEETGHVVRLGRLLTTVSYDLPHGRKHVRYWSAESVGGHFEANHEVDELDWLSTEQAADRLSYRLDRSVLKEFTRLPVGLTTLLLVRHARAGSRSRYRGEDRTRPLDATGREQAQALVPLLTAFGVSELHSANPVRCVETLTPTRDHLGGTIVAEAALSETAYADDPAPAHARIRDLAKAGDGRVRAVCSQGKVIPPLMQWWAQHDGLLLPEARNRKGSVWVLSTLAGALVAADHIDSPLPRLDH
ncbi:NUDIX hydrolase [Gordonia oryzae]|uniref:NUDIX hydrolase n=1 Tax=Gordonia oryzae TaxID=2487349 RepID=A0A3N4H9Z1_9ACTN|nr:bifunctional NUDIX hydrolase/histidine phosphatase family protein [Gordonia oryzae]RPA62224.1 NUDIX hydrolase [Gordonia oryzae]